MMGYQRASDIASDNIEPLSYKLDHQTTDHTQVQYDGRYLHSNGDQRRQPAPTINYNNFQESLDTPLKPAERYLLAKARSATISSSYAQQQQQPIPTIPNKSKTSRNRSQARAAKNANRDRARSYLYDSPNKDLSSSISELSSNVSSPSSTATTTEAATDKDDECNNRAQTPEVPAPQSVELGDTSGHETKAVRRKKYKPRHRDNTLNRSLTSVIKPLQSSSCMRRPSSPNTTRSRDKLLASFDSSFNSVVSDLSIRSVDFSASMEIYFFEK